MDEFAVLQIQEFAAREAEYVEYVVRCIEGEACAGMEFSLSGPRGDVRLRLVQVEMFGKVVSVVTPPHAAKVKFTGDISCALSRMDELTAISDGGSA